jgi:hypothetical protein
MCKSRQIYLNILLFAFVLSFAVIGTTHVSEQAMAATFENIGNGSIESPYEVSTDNDLLIIATNINSGSVNGYEGKYFLLKNDIDLTDVSASVSVARGWMPIGTDLLPFRGTLLGSGKTISGVNIARDDTDYIGLFGTISENASIKNLTIEGDIRGKNYTGAVVGYNKGEIVSCINKATVADSVGKNAMHIGGIAGYNKGAIRDSANYGCITNNYYIVGGIAGTNIGVIRTSFNKGTIIGNSTVGGVAGVNEINGEISEVFNNGAVTADSIGGGIIGDNKQNIINAYNRAALNGKSGISNMIGGIVGNNDTSAKISNVYNSGEVNCYGLVGAISSYNFGVIQNAYYDKEVFDGEITNGMPATLTYGYKSKNMLDADTLTNAVKLMGLSIGDGSGAWSKRSYINDYCYYPELAVFSGSDVPEYVAESQNSVQFERVQLAANDIDLSETTFVYNAETHDVDILLGNERLIEGLDYSITANSVNASSENGASISVEFKNYYIGTVTKYFTILKSPITILWSNEIFVYNGTVQHHTASVASGKIDDENITFDYQYGTNITADTHSVIAILADTAINANYSLSSETHEYSIAKQPITISWSNEVFTYNGQVQYRTAMVATGKIGADNITFTYIFDDCVKAKQQIVTAQLNDTEINQNYSFEAEAHIYFIGQQEITIAWDEVTLCYNGLTQHPTVTVSSGRIGKEDITFAYLGYSENINASNGNAYNVTVELADTTINTNYYFAGASKNYDIDKQPLSILWNDAILNYNGTAQIPQFSIASGQIGNEAITFAISDFSANISASEGNSYSIIVSLATSDTNGNYLFSAETKYYDIAKANIYLAWDETELIYNGQIQHPNAVITSEVHDTINLIYSDYFGKNAGSEYSIVIISESTNYEITNTLTYSILPKPLTVEWSEEALYYNGQPQCPTAILIGAVRDEAATFLYGDFSDNINPFVSGGQYSVSVMLDDADSTNDNYILGNTATWNYAIERKGIIIDAVSAVDRAYDKSVEIELRGGLLIGIINGDKVTLSLGIGILMEADSGLNKVISTNILILGSDSYKYILTQPTLTVNVVKAVISTDSIIFASQTFTFNNAVHSLAVSGNVSDEIADIIYENNAKTQIGKYSVTAKFVLKDAVNYEMTGDMNATLYISPSSYKDNGFDKVSVIVTTGYIQYDALLSITEIAPDDVAKKFNKQKVLIGFDLKLLSNTQEIQPNGRIKVSVQLDDKQLKAKNIKLFYLDETNGQMEIESQIIGNELVFYTEHLSQYIIVADRNYTWIWFVGVGVLLMVFLGILLRKKMVLKHATANEAEPIITDLGGIGGVQYETVGIGVIVQAQKPKPSMKIKTEMLKVNEEIQVPESDTSFEFDGVYCRSFVSFRESLKYKTSHRQNDVCALAPQRAVQNALAKNAEKKGLLYWRTEVFKIGSVRHKELLIEALQAQKKMQNEE